MENILLVILLIVALAMTGLVLVQRNEGGGLGIGGGGGVGGMGGRPKANPLARLTWILGAAFFALSIALTILNNQGSADRSVIGNISTDGDSGDGLLPPTSNDESLLPPSTDGDTATDAGDDTLLPPTAE